MKNPMNPKLDVKNTCKIGQGKDCCRYLIVDGGGFECAKLNPELKETLDLRANSGRMNARGDNCEGVA